MAIKALEAAAGTDNADTLAKKHKVKVAWGTDTLFDPGLATRQGEQLAKMATAANADLLARAGSRNPYPRALLHVDQARSSPGGSEGNPSGNAVSRRPLSSGR